MIYFLHVKAFFLLTAFVPLLYILIKTKNNYCGPFSKDILDKLRVKSGGLSQKSRNIILLFSLVFVIIALARPVINGHEIKVGSKHFNLVVGIDISKSMFVKDIYPNRLEFAKKKLYILLEELKNIRVSIIGFNTFSYLVAPFSEDYNSLNFLVKNINTHGTKHKGTNFMSLLRATVDLYNNKKQKELLIFTDGGDKNDFKEEIKYAKKHNITVFVYAIGSDEGNILKINKKPMIDKNGNIMVFSINEKIKNLADKSGGKYMKYTLSKTDITNLSYVIKSQFKAIGDKDSFLMGKKELFYYPLVMAIFLFFMANFSLRRKKV